MITHNESRSTWLGGCRRTYHQMRGESVLACTQKTHCPKSLICYLQKTHRCTWNRPSWFQERRRTCCPMRGEPALACTHWMTNRRPKSLNCHLRKTLRRLCIFSRSCSTSAHESCRTCTCRFSRSSHLRRCKCCQLLHGHWCK
ncbi:hypothetical protein FR483_n789L [Paramecium bursaria Chlorella virus FR483]|uniref:Uncharacterized protein n789L n=1 Tax=Paramecium bursaria Chlorella virus FR483 TaxID=399781 RepID=A7J8E3_PBCVF|nr:hypothetical protein FR483_n789L [Paramecium bursaria Chlorella virus FR483]ABT16074.1 hypothetical protein FR483_n789L [Paramecium bursaria Chlorella virus FR483]